MKQLKDKFSRVLSLLLMMNMVLSLVVATDICYYSNNEEYGAFAAESSVLGLSKYSTAAGNASLTIGNTYNFGGYEWIAAEEKTGYIVKICSFF